MFDPHTGDNNLQPKNLAARAGRWSATHRKTAILGWILFVVLATVIGGKIGQNQLKDSASGNGDSKRGAMIVDDAGFPDEVGERVLIQGKGSIKSDDPQVTAAVKDVVNRLEGIKGVKDIESPLNAQQRANTVSKDGRSVLVTFSMPAKTDTKAELEKLETVADAPLAAVAAVQKAHPELLVDEHGAASEAEGHRAAGARRRGQGDAGLAGRHADHPADRVRRRRRRRRPAVARRSPRSSPPPACSAPASQLMPLHAAVVAGRDAHRPRRRASTTRCSTCAG